QGAFHAGGPAGEPVQDARATRRSGASHHGPDRCVSRRDRRQHRASIADGIIMSRIKLVVSDVDGTLLTKHKTLTDRAKAAIGRLGAAGIGFTIVSSRPTVGM